MIQEPLLALSPECYKDEHENCDWASIWCLCSCHNVELPKSTPKVEANRMEIHSPLPSGVSVANSSNTVIIQTHDPRGRLTFHIKIETLGDKTVVSISKSHDYDARDFKWIPKVSESRLGRTPDGSDFLVEEMVGQ